MQSSFFVGLSRHFAQQFAFSGLRHTLPRDVSRLSGSRSLFSLSACRSNVSAFTTGRQSVASTRGPLPFWLKAGGVTGIGLGLSFFAAPTVHCESYPTVSPTSLSKPSRASPGFQSPEAPPPPQSSVSYYELTFGTIAGVCAGVFVKKGAKAVAFMLGGVFVLLQYLGSLSLLRVDWSRAASRFENLFYTTDAAGHNRPPNVGSLFRWITDFLTADFQQRASFIAGFVLGIRIG
ncbi:hypothetical protein DAEQUDRAFT_745853 [Daedalea quercina L-15889]|uniref:FUN14-domain-containing protein n=1 Tax=Daedalea quercina L-15889 TaxID=1314783 RepID=A0A165PHC4_9APHY|nr:hypothetical protein DAEQUDRAFT_745853 [Daedalea quercina L-15889]